MCSLVEQGNGLQKKLKLAPRSRVKPASGLKDPRRHHWNRDQSPTNRRSRSPTGRARNSLSKDSSRHSRTTGCSARRAPRANRKTAADGSSTPSTARAISFAARARGLADRPRRTSTRCRLASHTSRPPVRCFRRRRAKAPSGMASASTPPMRRKKAMRCCAATASVSCTGIRSK